MRLIQGDGAFNEGRVEVFLDYSWKPLCVSSWTLSSADVICQAVGFQNAVAAKWQNVPMDLYGSSFYLDLSCTNENNDTLNDCIFEKKYYSLCDASERGAAAVICHDSKCF